MSISDDESFVVLGSSPYVSLNTTANNTKAEKNDSELDQQNGSLKALDKSNYESLTNSLTNGKISNSQNAAEGSMAASFLLGEISSETIKESVYSQFPSICSSLSNTSDVAKLQKLVSSHTELKDTLLATNETLKQWIAKTMKWKEDSSKQIKEFQEEVATLRNENLNLRKELCDKVEQIKISESIMREENNDLRKAISEKSAQIQNMCTQIQILEEQQLNSFDLLKENQEKDIHNDYVPKLEHERIVKDFERNMSKHVAENLEIKEMQAVYIDEINCLKVNLTSLEELYKKSKDDIAVLKGNDVEKSKSFDQYEQKISQLTEEMKILKFQVEVYQKDFEIERESRQTMAGERDQLLTELKKLQLANQQLIETAEAHLEKSAAKKPVTKFNSVVKTSTPSSQPSTSSATTATSTTPDTSQAQQNKPSQEYDRAKYSCPLCNKEFNSFHAIQTHVQICIDGN